MRYIDCILAPKTIKAYVEIASGALWYVTAGGRYKLPYATLTQAAKAFKEFEALA